MRQERGLLSISESCKLNNGFDNGTLEGQNRLRCLVIGTLPSFFDLWLIPADGFDASGSGLLYCAMHVGRVSSSHRTIIQAGS
jgi:hypothetical protein